MADSWTDILVKSFREVAARLAGYAPRVLAVLTLVLAGWIVAAVIRRFAIRILRAADLDGRSQRWGLTTTLRRTGLRRSPSELVGEVIFWVIFLIGLLMAIEALEVPAAVGLAPVIIRFLANLLAQALLIFIVNARLSGGPALAAGVRWLVILFSIGVALTQLGIAREM